MKIYNPSLQNTEITGSVSLTDSVTGSLLTELTSSFDVRYPSITLFNEYTQSVNLTTGSSNDRLNNIESYTSSLQSAITVSDNDVTILGDLTVQGDTVTLNVTNLLIEDKLIVLASGSTTSADANGAGIFISGADASILWDHSNLTLDINKSIDVSGSITLSGKVNNVDIYAFSQSYDYFYGYTLTSLSESSRRTDILEGLVISKEIVSSSEQIATQISGAFTSVSESIRIDILNVDDRLDQIEINSGSTVSRLSNIELFSGSQESKNTTLAIYTSSIDSKFSDLSSYTSSNDITNSTQTSRLDQLSIESGSVIGRLTNIESFSASVNSKFDTLGNYTSSIDSKFEILATYTGSNDTINSTQNNRLDQLSTFSSSAIDRLDQLSIESGSANIRLTNLESFSSSINTKFDTLSTYTSSNDTTNTTQNNRLDFLSVFSGSADSRLTNIESNSGSYARTDTNNSFVGHQTFNNITVNGTASFGYIQSVTGSAKIIGDAYVVLNNNAPGEPFAGIKVIDSGSVNITSSLLWDGNNNHWIYENVSGSTYGAAGFIGGPRSTDINNILYPTQYKVLRSQGGDHLYDSNITDNDTNVEITIPLNVTSDITASGVVKSISGFDGTLTGNASTATTASYVDYLNVANKPTLVSGSSQVIDILSSLNTYTGSNDTTNTTQNNRLDQLSTASGSAIGRLNNLETFSGSANIRLANLESTTSSLNLQISDINTYTSSLKTAFTASGATVLFQTGSVGTPSISVTGDTNTGIYFPAEDTIALVEGGNQALTINSLGTVVTSGSLVVSGSLLVQRAEERIVTASIAATGTINYDVLSQSVLYYTTNASNNWTLNLRGNASNTLNNIMETGRSLTVVFMVTNGATPYKQTALQIDGGAVTPRWQGGAQASGSASSVDSYTVVVMKTGNASYSVFESITQFK